MTSSSPSHHLLEAHITVLPKEGKDETQVSNYHSIPVLNMDMKLQDKILMNQNVLLPEEIVTQCKANFPFIVLGSLELLTVGIQIPTHLSKTY